jgi:hypothetical protein
MKEVPAIAAENVHQEDGTRDVIQNLVAFLPAIKSSRAKVETMKNHKAKNNRAKRDLNQDRQNRDQKVEVIVKSQEVEVNPGDSFQNQFRQEVIQDNLLEARVYKIRNRRVTLKQTQQQSRSSKETI